MRAQSRGRIRRPTWTSVVMEHLVGLDDLVETRELRRQLGMVSRVLWATLCTLQRYRAVDCVASADGLHWFATPQTDSRVRHPKEIVEGITRRRRRPALLSATRSDPRDDGYGGF